MNFRELAIAPEDAYHELLANTDNLTLEAYVPARRDVLAFRVPHVGEPVLHSDGTVRIAMGGEPLPRLILSEVL